jgi:ribose/xylose/arabinose/galactoside ABC-type transport system permease subunit
MQRSLASTQFGLIVVILLLSGLLTLFSGSHSDGAGHDISNFLNVDNLVYVLTETSTFAIMAVGATMVIITAGIDLSVGSIYAISGVLMAMFLRAKGLEGPSAIVVGFLLCVGIGVLAGILNGVMVCTLKVHPFIITLGTMWIYRGIAFVASRAESILVPSALTEKVAKASLGLPSGLYLVPTLVTLAVMVGGVIYLTKTVAGRRVFAVGGNPVASLYSGVKVNKTLIGVYTICGLTAGIASYFGNGYYGAASCADAQGYELYVIASAVVGGVSLTGGKGSAFGATLGALLIVLIRQAIRQLHFDSNYEWIIIGSAIIIAVVLDRLSGNLAVKRAANQGAQS